ncbi:SpaH/EbpB family LPXTG-anchored major pilin [Bifidobacterium callimiconis]|uniref:Fimbrial subunit FimA n=1 Tax=Bifidobacterium callimiconis TaxID=2306973 RepID=A0A430FB35_9BIFI|nr:SpaH/EbpB family LPXTG-anchored major pilin [Bifidobacterium callimiconis]MBT1177723.1 SpaH/EbpB family LPXTG-anchored major pilin [Bifidobacterium callimiconis]RSX50046.1 Fimbrial subunit FimA [Bifidobacterium callimiconis]
MKMRKLFAGVAAAATLLSGLALGATAANAAETRPDSMTITMNADNAVQFKDHTYKAVKIGKYDVSTGAQVLVASPAMNALVKSALEAAGVKDVPAESSDYLQWAISNNKLDASGTSPFYGTTGVTRKFADALAQSTAESQTPVTPQVNGATATFNLGEVGYWLIVDQNAVNDKSSKSLAILVGTPWTLSDGTVVSAGTINVKNQTATVDKTVDDQTVAIGKDATYTITTKIPNYVGYKVQGYTFQVKDKFADNAPLAYKAGTLTVKVGDTPLTSDQYTVAGFDAASKTFTVDLSSYIQSQGFSGTADEKSLFDKTDLVGKTVTITYSATVTGTIGNQGAPNSPSIVYPNDPSDNEKKDEIPGTPVKVFNFDYNLKKIDRTTGAVLQGAKFAIKDKTSGKWLGYVAAAGETPARWVELAAEPTADENKTEADGVFTTGENGLVSFKGLDAGSYTIKEIAAPDDYVSVGLTFDVKIDANISGSGSEAVATPTYTVTGDLLDLVSDGNTSTVTVENVKSLTQLPVTGAAGIALFVAVGALLAGAGAAVYAKSTRTRRLLNA